MLHALLAAVWGLVPSARVVRLELETVTVSDSDYDRIPASYYAVPNHAPIRPTASSLPQTALPWYRQVPGFRSGRRLNAAIALIGYLVIAAWIVQFPWNPSLGILGVLSTATVIVAFNVFGSRTRLPIFRSSNKVLAGAAWSIVAIAILVAAGSAAPSSSNRPQGSPGLALGGSSPTPTEASPIPTPTLGPSPSPKKSPSPSPKPTPPPASPRPVKTPITFVNGPLTAAPNQIVTLYVRTAKKTYCTIEVDYSSGPSTAQGLTPKTSDTGGNVSWTWKVGGRTKAGTWPITVSCGNSSAKTSIRVT